MTSNGMSSIAEKFSTIPCYHIGSNRISRSISSTDYNTVAAGLALWYGVILDYNSMFCLADRVQINHGRIMKHAIDGWPDSELVLTDLLSSLDELGSILLKNISSSTGFKAQSLRKELKTWSVASWLAPLKGCLLEIFYSGLNRDEDGDLVRIIRCIRQVACFLKKLDISRPDLEETMIKEFLDFEEHLTMVLPERGQTEAYKAVVFEMKRLLNVHMDGFSMDPFADRKSVV